MLTNDKNSDVDIEGDSWDHLRQVFSDKKRTRTYHGRILVREMFPLSKVWINMIKRKKT